MKLKLVSSILGTILTVSVAQADEPDELTGITTNSTIILNDADSEAVANSKKLGEDIARQLLESYSSKRTLEMESSAKEARARVDSIADEAIQKERDRTLEFLGIDPQASSGVYVFLSWSMPLPLLRTYAIEAMWGGATLVFKGVPPDKSIGDFIAKDLRNLVYDKGAAANISLDPRLFDAYSVNTAPTIVLTTLRSNMQCQGIAPVAVEKNGLKGQYDTCPAIDESLYDKMQGSVSLGYALQEFKDSGRSEASTYLQALAKGYEYGYAPPKSQIEFNGRWEDVTSPSSKIN